MTPHIAKALPDEDIQIFEKIRIAVDALPDLIDLGQNSNGKILQINCHILAEATAITFGLQRQSGFYYLSAEHSWVLTKTSNIIDVYPVAIYGGPILVANYSITGRIYCGKRIRPDLFGSDSFKKAVDIVVNELKK